MLEDEDVTCDNLDKKVINTVCLLAYVLRHFVIKCHIHNARDGLCGAHDYWGVWGESDKAVCGHLWELSVSVQIGITDPEDQRKVLSAVQEMHLDQVDLDTLTQLENIDNGYVHEHLDAHCASIENGHIHQHAHACKNIDNEHVSVSVSTFTSTRKYVNV